MSSPRILILDIETAPLLSYTWGLFDQNVALNQIKGDWHLLSWAAKWIDSSEVMYLDQRHSRDIENDKGILQKLWKLLDEADIVVGQNVKSFDIKKINARFLIHGMHPPSSFRVFDTLTVAKKHFAMTSNKLEYLSNKLNVKYKKLKHAKFSGFELWKECLAGNVEAWNEMMKYNKYDVLSTEELYLKLQPWDNSIDHNVYHDDANSMICTCGSKNFKQNGFAYTSTGRFKRYKCKDCGKETRSKVNLLSKEKKESLPGTTKRG